MPKIKTINPYTQDIIMEYEEHSNSVISEKITELQNSFDEWKKSNFDLRRALVQEIKNDLNSNYSKYAKIITDEMGKPITEAKAEVLKCVTLCDYYIENAESQLLDIVVDSSHKKSEISFRPLGIILAIMPWNFPFWQVFRFAIPTLMAGNTAILKHASNVSGCSLEIAQIFHRACNKLNIKNVFESVIVSARNVEKIISNKKIKGVSITGSVNAGKEVAKNAGFNLKKSVLELGGNDPYIILKDADIDLAAKICAKSKMINAGQTCISAKRFIVVDNVYDEFLNRFKEELQQYKEGDPNDKNTKLGTLVSISARDSLHEQVTKAIENGAKCILGGKIKNNNDAFYPPTILTNVKENNPIFDEELFGPVAVVFKVKDEEQAIEIANNSSFGLGSAIFSKNEKHALELAKNKIAAGCCFINDFVKSDPYLPFGGINDSGYGRELSEFGIREFTNIKTVVLN